MIQKIFDCIDARADEYKEFLREIVCIESHSNDKDGVDAVGACIRTHAEAWGFQTQVVPFEKSGDGLLVTMNADAALPPITFTGHMDTVFPRGTFPTLWREEDGILYGPGVADMKGGLAMGLMVMRALQDAGWTERPIKFIFVPDEEVSESLSGEAGKAFIMDNARGSAAAITLEAGSSKRVTVGRKGSIRYKVNVIGRATHAGNNYAQGISAVKEAALKVLEIEKASNQDEITYNCGIFRGGTSANTVPGETEFTLYNRYWRLEQRQEIRDHVESIIAKSFIPGTTATFEITGERLPMDATEDNYALAAHVKAVGEKYGFGPLEPFLKSGGSDASYTTMAGVPSVCSMGPGGFRVHSVEEYMPAETLVSRAKLLAAVVTELPAEFGPTGR